MFEYSDFKFVNQTYNILPYKFSSIIVIRLTKYDSTFNSLTSFYHHEYIKHNIPNISNEAPTLEQYYQELLVYKPEIIREKNKRLIECEPNQDFFIKANENFTVSNNSRQFKYKYRPLYYYYFDNNKVIHLNLQEARKLYCKKYQELIMNNDESKFIFMNIINLCKNRDKNKKIIISAENIKDIDEINEIIFNEWYNNTTKIFTFYHCLIEMLIKYPNFENCIWNKE